MPDIKKHVDLERGTTRAQAYRGGITTVTVYPPIRQKPVGYTSRAHLGKATVVEAYKGATGYWVKLFDKQRATHVTVRPAQVSL